MTPVPLDHRLRERQSHLASPLCVGIDPRPDRLPREFLGLPPAEAFLGFGRAVVELTAEHALAFKIQAAFFEALGPDGVVAYDRLAREIRARGIPVIADCKRGDIGSTAAAYATSAFGTFGDGEPAFDAITVNPYFGRDGLAPFFDAAREIGGSVFVLVKTSNPSAADLQDRRLEDGRRLHECVADELLGWTAEWGDCVGAVVGATQGEDVAALRKRMPKTWILLPGVGAQGAGADDAARARDAEDQGVLVNLSRGITQPWGDGPAPEDWRDAIAGAARHWHGALATSFGLSER